MFFLSCSTTIIVWGVVFALSICSVRCLLGEWSSPLLVRALAAVAWCGIIVFLLMNWCNVAAALLMSHLVLAWRTWRTGLEEMPNICLTLNIWVEFAVVNLAIGVVIILTQSYTPVFIKLDSHPIKSYQITDSYYYLTNGRLAHDYLIRYVTEDDFSEEVINLSVAKLEDVRLCVDATNPRVEKIIYCQDLIDHCIIGGDVNLGTVVAKEELVIYLPEDSEVIEKSLPVQNN